ncbi:MAG: FmdB family zinc ribbon protein [Candidatus Marinamargulisbacteria bacterium]|jgi:putative FmdB family regulatory protein
MPTYQYRCKSCAHEFETVQSMMDAPLTDCPQCSADIFRVIQSVGIQFKGTGFYANDSQSKSKSNSE